MRFSIVAAIALKELRETLRDRRTLLMMLGLPVLLYPLLIVGFGRLQASQQDALESRPSHVALWGRVPGALRAELSSEHHIELIDWAGCPDDVRAALESGALSAPSADGSMAADGPGTLDEGPLVEPARAALRTRELDAIVIAPQDTAEAFDRAGRARVVILFDSVFPESVLARQRLRDRFEAARGRELARRERAADLPEGFTQALDVEALNVAAPQRRAGRMLGTMLPFVILALSLMGGLYPAIDATAGEKERGTMQTLLCAPIAPIEIVVGKFVAVCATGLTASAVNLLSLGATLSRLVPAGSVHLDPSRLLLVFALLIPVSLTTSAVFLAVAVFAKDFKDGQNFVTPVYIALILPAAASLQPGLELNPWTAFVPLVNIALLIKAMFVEAATLELTFLVVVSSATYATLALMLAARVFQQETVLLGAPRSWRAVFGRQTQLAVGTPALALLTFALSLVLQFYASLSLAGRPLFLVLLTTQVGLILLPALFVARWARLPVRSVFLLRRPSLPAVAGAALIGLSAWTIAAGIVLRILPPPDVLARSLQKMLLVSEQGGSLIGMLLLVGVLPAVCEETFFRGLIMQGFRRHGAAAAIGTSALAFALAHASIYRLLPTLVLGAVLGWVAWQTGSILCSMAAHALNNSLIVLLVNMPALGHVVGLSNDVPPWPVTIGGVITTILGMLLMGMGRSADKSRAETPI